MGITTANKTARRARRMAGAAGWIGVGMGLVHVVVSPLGREQLWSDVVDEGVWNTFSIDTPVTLSALQRAEAFWTTFGSFGVPVLALGAHVVWSVRQGHRVPGWLGWILIAWGVPLVIVCPVAPGWAFPLMGGLIVVGDRVAARTERGTR